MCCWTQRPIVSRPWSCGRALLSKDVVVPVSWVEAVEEDEIILAADKAMLEKLPEYRPSRSDEQITADVSRRSPRARTRSGHPRPGRDRRGVPARRGPHKEA